MRPLAEPAVRERHPKPRDFEAFFQSEYTRPVRALYLLSGDRADAEDAAQEAMARVYERWDRVREMDAPDGYLYRVALHVERRRRYRLGLQAR
jgi:DNA-directed RNA polymerase specialized sigma24 family protein